MINWIVNYLKLIVLKLKSNLFLKTAGLLFLFIMPCNSCTIIVPVGFSDLRERVDRELREKEKIRSDLEKAEKQKTQLANEVDEHHSAIEHMNNLNLR